MDIKELITSSRSRRRFYQEEELDFDTLKELVDLARLSPSGGNKQPLKYILSHRKDINQEIFPCLSWAGYIEEWEGPGEGEKPSAYIIIMNDKRVSDSPGCDHGIAAQSILLGAAQLGLGGCIIGSVDRARLRKALKIDEEYEILLVIALGRAREEVVIEEVGPEGDIRYWRDEKGIHHVPKRSISSIIPKLSGFHLLSTFYQC